VNGVATASPGLVALWSIVTMSPLAAAPARWRTWMPEKVTTVFVTVVSPELCAIGTSNHE